MPTTGRRGAGYEAVVDRDEGLARADIVTVYDAEDRPDPQQLREAAARFAADRSGRWPSRVLGSSSRATWKRPRQSPLRTLAWPLGLASRFVNLTKTGHKQRRSQAKRHLPGLASEA